MEEAGRRKSERPERKGAKNTVFRITIKGRRELPGLLKGMSGPVAEASKRLYGEALAGVGAGRTGTGAHSGETSSAGSTLPGRQLPAEEARPTPLPGMKSTSPPSAYDPYSEAA
jgi:hypothetical protein